MTESLCDESTHVDDELLTLRVVISGQTLGISVLVSPFLLSHSVVMVMDILLLGYLNYSAVMVLLSCSQREMN